MEETSDEDYSDEYDDDFSEQEEVRQLELVVVIQFTNCLNCNHLSYQRMMARQALQTRGVMITLRHKSLLQTEAFRMTFFRPMMTFLWKLKQNTPMIKRMEM